MKHFYCKHLVTIQLPPSVQYGKDSICKIIGSLARVMKFIIIPNVIKYTCSCLLNLAHMSVNRSPHLLPLIPTSHHPARATAVKDFKLATAVKQYLYTTHTPSYIKACTIYAWSINEPHRPFKIGLHIMQSHPLHKGDQEIKNCYGSHAQNAVRWLALSIQRVQDAGFSSYVPPTLSIRLHRWQTH